MKTKMNDLTVFTLKVVLVAIALIIISITTIKHNTMVAEGETYCQSEVAKVTISRNWYRTELTLYQDLWDWCEDILQYGVVERGEQ